jgi:PII-like signaling protein/nucleotide-binding universal stress UspA family protein
MFQRILLVIDASAAAQTALDYAIELARNERAELRIIGVVPIPEISGTIDEVRDAQRTGREELWPVLRTVRDRAAEHGQPVITEVLYGGQSVIAHYAETHGCDLIVLEQRYEHLGHIADKVAFHVACPVYEVWATQIVKYTGSDERKQVHWEVRKDRREKLEGSAKMLCIYIGEDDKLASRPLYEAVVARLRELDVAGATVQRCLMGYGAQQRLHRSGLLHLSPDAPIVIVSVDAEEKIRDVVPELEKMVSEGLVVLSNVEIIKYVHRHGEPSSTTGEGR